VGHPPVFVAAVAGELAAFGSDQPCSCGGCQGCTPNLADPSAVVVVNAW